MGSSRTIKGGWTGILLLLACLLVLTRPTAAIAHTTSTGLATLTVTGSVLTYRLTLVLSELPEEPARLFAAAVDGDPSSIERVATLLRQSLQIRIDDRLCRSGRATLQHSRLGDTRLTLELTFYCPVVLTRLVIHDDWFHTLGEHYHTLARIEGPGGVHQVAFLPDVREAVVVFSTAASQHATSFFWLGIEHILTGYDHLLFLVAILLRGGRFVTLAKIVTAFTLAHSLTLAVAVLVELGRSIHTDSERVS